MGRITNQAEDNTVSVAIMGWHKALGGRALWEHGVGGMVHEEAPLGGLNEHRE